MESLDITPTGPEVTPRVDTRAEIFAVADRVARRIDLFSLVARVDDVCTGAPGSGVAVEPDDPRAVAIRSLVPSRC